MEEIENLKKENEKLKMMNENKSDFISISAHQIRTSLTAFKWTLKMLLKEELGDINEEQKLHLEKSMENNERTLALVNNLLSLSHANDASIIFHFKQINITNIIEKVISIFCSQLKSKNIKIIFNKPEIEIPEINCDEEMILVVFQNLIENAIKYGDNDADINISIVYKEKNKNILISINNKGIGIKKENESSIFNKFYRAPNAIEKETTGSGFGLFATKNIVERHGGEIWFESGADTGTTFYVILPISL